MKKHNTTKTTNKFTTKNSSLGSNAGGAGLANGPATHESTPPPPLDDVSKSETLESTLTPAEQKELKQLEGVIEEGCKTFLEVGKALMTISRDRLYRDKYETFANYCREKLCLSRSYAYGLIGSAEVNQQMSAIADIEIRPENEAQFRELLSVPEKKRVAAWKGALKLAGTNPVTAKIVHEAAAEFRPKSKGKSSGKTQAKVKTPAPDKAIDFATALKILARVEKAAAAAKSESVMVALKKLREHLEELAGA